ncbi:hypothetical protein Ciccas_007294 [Cichlidogyrus casuarinus]|uniref:Uncharacterized protein n=1 Tax=Cichlidogyrus casuarinus TaxID=1844966 RepID=A0ABD2Q3A9_9PLAT
MTEDSTLDQLLEDLEERFSCELRLRDSCSPTTASASNVQLRPSISCINVFGSQPESLQKTPMKESPRPVPQFSNILDSSSYTLSELIPPLSQIQRTGYEDSMTSTYPRGLQRSNVTAEHGAWRKKVTTDPENLAVLSKTANLLHLLNDILYAKSMDSKRKLHLILDFQKFHPDVFWLRFGDQKRAETYISKLQQRATRKTQPKPKEDTDQNTFGMLRKKIGFLRTRTRSADNSSAALVSEDEHNKCSKSGKALTARMKEMLSKN